VRGVYGLTETFETVVEHFDAYVTRVGKSTSPEVIRFPPLLTRRNYARTDHLETFPNLMGSVHSFLGTERELLQLIETKQGGADWSVAACRKQPHSPLAMFPAPAHF